MSDNQGKKTFSDLLKTAAVGTSNGKVNLSIEVEPGDVVVPQAGDTHGVKFGQHKGNFHQGDKVACFQEHFASPVVLTIATEPSDRSGWSALKGWTGGVEFHKLEPVVIRKLA